MTQATSASPTLSGVLYDGRPHDPASHDRRAILDPSTGDTIASIVEATVADTQAVVSAARRAFDSGPWRRLTPSERAPVLRKVAELVRRDAEELALLETRNNGMLFSVARAHVTGAAAMFDFYADITTMAMGSEIPVPGTLLDFTTREPIGVVATIIPWNAPLATAASKVAPALACGNAVVVKPSSLAPLTIRRLVELCVEAGVPDGTIGCVVGPGDTIGASLVRHAGVDKVSLTGDSATGREVMRLASETLKRLTLECGGKSPSLIFADADLDRAVADSLSAYRLAGQVCFAGTRLLVQRPVYDEFVEHFVARTRALVVGDPTRAETNIGPLISQAQLDRVARYVDIGRSEGATLSAGGARLSDGPLARGNFFQPTVFAEASNDMRVTREEIFGPVVVIVPFDTFETGIQLANDSAYGLAARVYTRDLTTALRAARQLRSGSIGINIYMVNHRQAPFGGFKESGFGREYGVEAIDAYTEIKNVVIGG